MSNKPTDSVSKLFNSTSGEMSEKETDLLMEQYKLYVEMMDKVSERRHQANSFFLTANMVLVTALTGFFSVTRQADIQPAWMIIAAIAGIIFCLTWRRLIKSYDQLNTGKFKVIHLLETRLPAKLFDAEWDALNRGDGTLYKPFTRIEVGVPLVFAGLYTALAGFAILDIFAF